jgi:hypothetical protein
MQIQRDIPVLLIAAAVAIGGCGDGFAGPEPLPEADHPLYKHGGTHVGYHYQLKENQKAAVHTSGGETYDFRIEVTLFADGLAAGTATLSNPHIPSRRFQYDFQTGRTACEDGTPVAYFQGVVDPAGPDQSWSWVVHILPVMEDQALFRGGEEERIVWTWIDDPAGRAGDSFVAPVSHLYASPDICGSG